MSSFQFQSSDVLARLKPFGILFEKSLSDLIKGIRSHSKDLPESLSQFLDNAIVECKNELTTNDMEVKAMAILKLAYLEMYGFEMSWCNFHILEVMSSNKFQFKRVGYLAAIQSFKNEQDLLILATNQFKKDLNSSNHIEIGLALSGIATIVTPSLSKDINDDVVMKLNHSKPYIRKKAILAMHKIFLQYPDSLRINFNKIIEKLDDEDISVVSATINVICEISKKNPKIFVNYLPKFFKILEETKNNWLIIRILKLFQSLSRVETRMKKKILPSIIDLLIKTQASSLVYECINCIIGGAMLSPDSSKDKDIAKFCIEQLMKFFETKDSNLKYVGLLALINIVKIFPTLIKKIKGVSNIIMECLNDSDLIIKQKALEICHYLISEDNIVDLIKTLLVQLIPQDLIIPDNVKFEIVNKILTIGSMNNYSNIPNFKWYVAVLKDIINLTLLPTHSKDNENPLILSDEINTKISVEIGNEFKNLSVRIPSIRSKILEIICGFITNVRVIDECPALLTNFYWIMGEYLDDLKISMHEADDEEDDEDASDEEENGNESNIRILRMGKKIEILNSLINFNIDKKLELTENLNFKIPKKLLHHKNNEILVVLIQFLVKLFSSIVEDFHYNYSVDNKLNHDKITELGYTLNKLISFLNQWENHSHYEIQERSLSWLEFLKLCFEAMECDIKQIEKLEEEEVEYYRLLRESAKEISDDSGDESGTDSDEDELEEEEENDYIDLSSDDDVEKPEDVPQEVQEVTNEAMEPEGLYNLDDERRPIPMLLTHILPTFFKSYSLNPVSKTSQRNFPVPEDLDLETAINSPQYELFSDGDDDISDDELDSNNDDEIITDKLNEITKVDENKQLQRLERIKYDPYYINPHADTKKVKKLIDLDQETDSSSEKLKSNETNKKDGKKDNKKDGKRKKLKKEKVLILSEEFGEEETSQEPVIKPKKTSKNMLMIDSSRLDNFELTDFEESENTNEYDIDLNEIRNKLLPVETEKKKKSKKSDKTTEKSSKKKKVKKSTNAKLDKSSPDNLATEEIPNATNGSKSEDKPTIKQEIKSDSGKNSPKPVIKKTKKKTKAIIE